MCDDRGEIRQAERAADHPKSMNTLLCALAVLLAVLVGVICWVTEDNRARARRWHRSGISQRQIAQRLGVSRHRVRAWLT